MVTTWYIGTTPNKCLRICIDPEAENAQVPMRRDVEEIKEGVLGLHKELGVATGQLQVNTLHANRAIEKIDGGWPRPSIIRFASPRRPLAKTKPRAARPIKKVQDGESTSGSAPPPWGPTTA